MHLSHEGFSYRQGSYVPQMVRNGSRIYEVSVERKGHIAETSFRDSFNLMPKSLSSLVGAYGLSVPCKPDFPHLFNRPENYDVYLPHLPPKELYCPEAFTEKRLAEFEKWYAENRDTPFHLPTQLREYCTNDVLILMHALEAFRREWKEITGGENVLRTSLTIASGCMRHYRTKHMEKDSLAISLEHGAERHYKQSVIALKWLKWTAHSRQLDVRHRDTQGSEYRHFYLDKDGREKVLFLDGYVERPPPLRPLALEFYGCAWHGCSSCYAPDVVCANGKTAFVNLEATHRREKVIRSSFYLESVWECEVRAALKRNKQMKEFFSKTYEYGPLDPHDAFNGVRTGPLKMVADLSDSDGSREIAYLDVNSLYP